MEIFSALGVDSTIAYQFALFVVLYMVMYWLVFKPYFWAFEERQKLTLGNKGLAEQYLSDGEKLQTEYEIRARDLNSQFKVIFDKARSEATQEQDRLMADARHKSAAILQSARNDLKTQVEVARRELTGQTADVTQAIITKILGKEMKL